MFCPHALASSIGRPVFRKWSARLLDTTAFMSVASLATLAALLPARAQTVISLPASPFTMQEIGTDQPDAASGTGNPGAQGVAPTSDINVVLSPGPAGSATFFTRGGNGGNGATQTEHSDGSGGRGGDGAPATNISVTHDSAAVTIQTGGGPLLSLSSQGGHGGSGGGPYNYGMAGGSGAGGRGGDIWLNVPPRSGLFGGTLMVLTQDGGPAVDVRSVGGDSGNVGDTSRNHVDSLTAPSASAAGDGGDISIQFTGALRGGWLAGVEGNPPTSQGSGLVATSQGGNGGAGGGATVDAFSDATGGKGGQGGNGGNISITFSGTADMLGAAGPHTGPVIPADDFDAHTSLVTFGILAQSLGGIGGVGGEAHAAIGNSARAGQGGSAGSGGIVEVTMASGTVNTSGYAAVGVMALSAGGSGGSGSTASSVFSSKGGNGGPGGDGGRATVLLGAPGDTTYRLITTSGEDSDAVVGMNLGGGGGYGGDISSGSALAGIFLGGHGANGGTGGPASIFNGYTTTDSNGDPGLQQGYVVSTTGDYSRGLVASSIGGGGGRGGGVFGIGAQGVNLSIGGNGGTGGDGGLVSVFNNGIIQTTGQHSVGIDAASIGGGGGAGGAATSVIAGNVLSVAVAVGGHGGTGGDAAAVNVTNVYQIVTMGADSFGIRAQSIGGGGGVGGASLAESFAEGGQDLYPTLQVTHSIGGNGGKGGLGDTTSVVNAGVIMTQGPGAGGILAQSIGGGGGFGGDSQGLSAALEASSLQVNKSVGGNGGSGGDAKSVSVLNSGMIWTLGQQAPGVTAQSVGGGGGLGGGGTINAGSLGVLSHGDAGSLQYNHTVGGQGGSGGVGGDVTVSNFMDASNDPSAGANAPLYGFGGILTGGDQSPGIFAQSVGGGGGSGGDTFSGGGADLHVNIAVGGNGGNGNHGGTVTVNNTGGTIVTTGAGSAGIYAQSVGGGGGRGGSAATGSGTDPLVSLGKYIGTSLEAALGSGSGSSGSGSSSGVTQVAENIWDAKGMVLGIRSSASRLEELMKGYQIESAGEEVPPENQPSSSDFTVDIGVGLGGKGGAAGNGGDVFVYNSNSSSNAQATIWTFGPHSPGIFAQSVGGGGGDGGAANPADGSNAYGALFQITVGLGGDGGSSGDGGNVTVESFGTILTSGDFSPGIFAQSVGGGGGLSGATATGPSPDRTVMNIELGGQDHAEGDGKKVSVTLDSLSRISTAGDESFGILAHSIGGGGGAAALYGSQADPATGQLVSDLSSLSVHANLAILGNLKNSSGGEVDVTLQPDVSITTTGRNAYGILAQSVGGGGGLILGGPSITDSVTPSTLFDCHPGAACGTGDGDDGGNVTVTTGRVTQITTSGNGAVGILAQSIAGGGGIIGGMDGVSFSRLASSPSGRKGYSGVVTVDSSGDITTTGAYAHGIFAQSAGSGGGVIGGSNGVVFAGNTGSCGGCDTHGRVIVNVNGGIISVSGAHSYGVAMVSAGTPGGENKAELTLDGGKILASGSASAAVFAGGLNNSITVQGGGLIDGGSTPTSTAIATWAGNAAQGTVTITEGRIRGSILLGNHSQVQVQQKGMLEMGPVLHVGADGVITNHGTLSTAAAGQIGKTTLTGTLVQSAAGRLVVDTNHATGEADRIDIQGSATLAGAIDVQSTNLSKGAVTVLTASNGVTLDPAMTGTQTYLFNFAPKTDGTSVQIQPQAEFRNVPGGLTGTQQQVASHLQEIWESGSALSGGFDPFATITDGNTYRQALDSLSGQSLGAIAAFRFTSSQNFVNNLYSCPVYGPSGATLTQDDCSWARLYGNQTTQGSVGDTLGYTASAQTMQFGVQKEIATNWFLGLSAGYESSDFDGDGGLMQVTGQAFLAGAVLKYQNGPWLVAGSIDAGYGWYDSDRTISIGATTLSAEASPVSWHAGIGGRISYQMPFQHWYAMPTLELGAFYVGSDGYTETGAGPFNLTVEPGSSFAYTAAASLEVGTLLSLGEGVSLRPFASVGVGVIGSDGWSATAYFAGFENATNGFSASSPIPDVVAKIAAGADLISSANIALQLQYNGVLSDQYASHTGMARLNYRF